MPWYIFGFLSAIFIGLRFVTTKKVLFHEHSAEFLAILAIVNFILIFPLIFTVELISYKILGLIFIEALILTTAFLFEIKSFREFKISTVAPLLNLSPLFLILLAYIFLGEYLNIFQFIGIIILVAGAYLLEPVSLNHNNNKENSNHPLLNLFSSRHSFYLFSALVLLSVVALLDKIILGMTDIFNLIFYSRMFFALNSFIFLWVFYDGIKGVKHGFSKVGIWVVIVALFMVLGDLSYFKAVSLTYVSLVVPIRRLSTLFAALVGGTLFKEEGIFRKTIACIIMIGGAILVVL